MAVVDGVEGEKRFHGDNNPIDTNSNNINSDKMIDISTSKKIKSVIKHNVIQIFPQEFPTSQSDDIKPGRDEETKGHVNMYSALKFVNIYSII